jgi:hypothetical protein
MFWVITCCGIAYLDGRFDIRPNAIRYSGEKARFSSLKRAGNKDDGLLGRDFSLENII